MGVLKRLPMIGKDLLEDTPVSRGCCQHRIAPSGGDTMVTVQRLYHTLPAQSTPSSAFIGHPPTTAITAYISITKNENSYAINISNFSIKALRLCGSNSHTYTISGPLDWCAARWR